MIQEEFSACSGICELQLNVKNFHVWYKWNAAFCLNIFKMQNWMKTNLHKMEKHGCYWPGNKTLGYALAHSSSPGCFLRHNLDPVLLNYFSIAKHII